MAINTVNRRFSLIGLGLAFVTVLPTPDGNIDTAAERQQHISLYAGITATTPTADSTPLCLEASVSFLAGPVASQSHLAGPDAAQPFVPGVVAEDTC